MRGRTWIAILLGATLGAVIALGVLALVGTRVIEGAVDATVLDENTLRSRAEFVVGRAGFNVLVLAAGALGGGLLGAIGYAVGRETGSDDRRLSLTPLVVIGGFVGTIVAYSVGTAGLGIGASIDDGIITVSVYRAILVAMAIGASVGGVVGGTAERIAHPEVLGLEGEAWPTNPVAFVREAMTAVGLPLIAAAVGIAFAFVLSQILLEASHTTALIVFGGVAAVVLFGATVIAAHPPKRDE